MIAKSRATAVVTTGASLPVVHDELALAEALELAGVGLEVRDAHGRIISLTNPRPNGPGVATRAFDAKIEGVPFSVLLTFDDTEALARERDLIQKAFFDELTGLPNRALAKRSVNALIEENAPPFLYVLFDIDQFTQLRHGLSADEADQVLLRIATRLGAANAKLDMIARIGGNQFMVLLAPAPQPPEANQLIAELMARTREPVPVGNRELHVSVSAGVARFPRDGRDFELLRVNAERAVALARRDGPGKVGYYDASFQAESSERSRDEQKLRAIIRDREIRCAYQPKVNLRTNEIVGVEALMRWIDEDGNARSPGNLIGLAIDLGLMDDLTQIIVSEVARQIDSINNAFGRDCLISINIGARQAVDEKFMLGLLDQIVATGFAKRFVLELTEEAFIQKSEFQDKILPMIRQIGARVSIDDFGIGYSSLSALAEISADEVKIDRTFITDVQNRPRSQNILRAIEALGGSLGMSIIVEGVETAEELAYLKTATEIDYAQGHYFAKPLMLDDEKPAENNSQRAISALRRPEENRSLGGRSR